MNKPKLLDLFSGPGGAAKGYIDAGFDVTGVDIKKYSRYPAPFIIQNALSVLRMPLFLKQFDFIHASPPCQEFSKLKFFSSHQHFSDINYLRCLLIQSGLPWVIENVPGAPLINPLILCGSMFSLPGLIRHRHFEFSCAAPLPPATCNHPSVVVGCYGSSVNAKAGRAALGWSDINQRHIALALPPAYTHFIGSYVLNHIL
jgi:DNA (cytosine-5)-methyltransferase 1